ncbi:HupE/UreJ family protein [uncultured Muriicola sp.]|uniref:HupE/UreJ family protein n=1 Tax=uncultured Muriicola sp. TaxID=1583102 RepID=UPI0026029988|nr:HupE/UreJ family protein [uncultured Muriicola sp.]
MEHFLFYVELGLGHVLDFNAYDHILFLAALAIPFTFRSWKQILTLVTIFTVAHCLSLAFSVYEIVEVNVAWIEFLIPITILVTALFNVKEIVKKDTALTFKLQSAATVFFGLIHGFGFSNYFKMLMAGEDNKLNPLLGFATGIELSQIIIIIGVLFLAFLLVERGRLPKRYFVLGTSTIVILISLRMIYTTWPV